MKKNKISTVVIAVILIAIAVTGLIPFLILLFTSFTSESGLLKYGYSFFPHEPTLEAYRYVIANASQLLNSYCLTIYVTVVGTVLGMLFMTMCAYALSRDDFKLKTVLSYFLFFTMLFSGGTVATFIWIARYLKLSDNVWVLILPLMMNAWNIFMLRTSCRSIPYSLIESAQLDGASEIYIFFRIVVPLAKTGIATIALLSVFKYWNDWYQSMMYMDTSDKTTLQYYLVKILNNVDFAKRNASSSGGLAQTIDVPDQSVRMAICIFAAAPMLCVFPFFQKYFVKGITVGSVKG